MSGLAYRYSARFVAQTAFTAWIMGMGMGFFIAMILLGLE